MTTSSNQSTSAAPLDPSRSGDETRGRGRITRSRLRARAALAVVLGIGLVGGAVVAFATGEAPHRTGDALQQAADARAGGQQVLGGTREPGVPSIQRLRHDNVDFTVTVAPARPGPNLVRIDATYLRGDRVVEHSGHGSQREHRFRVGTTDDDARDALVLAEPRPGTDGLWAVVDLPEGTGTILVSHGPIHRVPFAVETGFRDDGVRTAPGPTWAGPDGPECVTAAAAALIAGGSAPTSCPSEALETADADALRAVVTTLADRGVTELALESDDSPRSTQARALAEQVADERGVRIVDPGQAPGERNALLVLSGWDDAATSLARVSATPLRQQPIRSDGTWLAPWLLAPGVVDSTAGAVLGLDFDIRDDAAQQFSQTLATYFPGQSPTASGYRAWQVARGEQPGTPALYAASRAAYMPAQPGHEGHESEVAWFPGGTVTRVGTLP